MTDLLRLRVCSSLGSLRVQSETIAILSIIAQNPQLGQIWFDTITDANAKQFHKHWHNRIVAAMKALDVYVEYERGSNIAFHTRASGIAFGYLRGGSMLTNAGSLKLEYQEAGTPEQLLYWLCVHMRYYGRILPRAPEFLPEVGSDFTTCTQLLNYLALLNEVATRAQPIFKRARAEGRLYY